jgi:hypothetical protein
MGQRGLEGQYFCTLQSKGWRHRKALLGYSSRQEGISGDAALSCGIDLTDGGAAIILHCLARLGN